jgi:hypothetical protein
MSNIENHKNSVTKITPEIEYLKGLKELGEEHLKEFFANSRQRQELDEFKEREELKLMQQQIQNNHEIDLGWQKVEIEKIRETTKDKLSGRIFSFLTLLICLSIFIFLIVSGNKDLLLPFTAFIAAIIGLVALYIHNKKK